MPQRSKFARLVDRLEPLWDQLPAKNEATYLALYERMVEDPVLTQLVKSEDMEPSLTKEHASSAHKARRESNRLYVWLRNRTARRRANWRTGKGTVCAHQASMTKDQFYEAADTNTQFVLGYLKDRPAILQQAIKEDDCGATDVHDLPGRICAQPSVSSSLSASASSASASSASLSSKSSFKFPRSMTCPFCSLKISTQTHFHHHLRGHTN